MERVKQLTIYSMENTKMTNTSWSKLQKKYNLSKNKIYSALKGKRRPRGSQYWQKRKQNIKLKSTTSHTNLETE